MEEDKRNKAVTRRFLVLGGIVVALGVLLLLTSRNTDNRIFNVETVYDTVFVARDSVTVDSIVVDRVVGHRSSKVDKNPWRGRNRAQADGVGYVAGSAKTRHPLVANDENCRAFANMVTGMFSTYYYTLLDNDGSITDKYVDLLYETCKNDSVYTFGVVCRWFSECPEDGVEWCGEEDLGKYGTSSDCPVFLVVGIGGSPEKPEGMYVLRAWGLRNVLSGNFLAKVHKKKVGKKFYYKPEGPWLN